MAKVRDHHSECAFFFCSSSAVSHRFESKASIVVVFAVSVAVAVAVGAVVRGHSNDT